VAKWQTQRT